LANRFEKFYSNIRPQMAVCWNDPRAMPQRALTAVVALLFAARNAVRRVTLRLVQAAVQALFRAYLRAYHGFSVRIEDRVPERGAFLALTSHFSILDTIALMAADPFKPLTVAVVKESLMDAPVIGGVLRAWGMIPVSRRRRDVAALREVLEVWGQERGVCIAAQGMRSRSGRLGPMNRVLVRLAVHAARRGVPVFPVVEIGTFEALPPGRWFPARHPISVVISNPLDLMRWSGDEAEEADLEALASLIQSRIAGLLPPERRPLPGTPALAERESRTAPA